MVEDTSVALTKIMRKVSNDAWEQVRMKDLIIGDVFTQDNLPGRTIVASELPHLGEDGVWAIVGTSTMN